MSRMVSRSACISLALVISSSAWSTTSALSSPLWILTEPVLPWNWQNLSVLSPTSIREKAVWDKSIQNYRGYLLREVVDLALKNRPSEQKAQIDLVILTGQSQGHLQKVFLPRALAVKYPVLLAGDSPRFDLISPLSSKPKIAEEGLPVARYFIQDVQKIELSSYQSHFGALLLKRRTDPLAVRGEKIFIHSCVSCHAEGQKPEVNQLAFESKSTDMLSKGHSLVKDFPKLSEKDGRSLLSYVSAIRSEQVFKTAAR